jgi:hypothetical protein
MSDQKHDITGHSQSIHHTKEVKCRYDRFIEGEDDSINPFA